MRCGNGTTLVLSVGTTGTRLGQIRLWRRQLAIVVALLAAVPAALAQPTEVSGAQRQASDVLPVEVSLGPAFCASMGDIEREVTRRSPRVHFVAPTGTEPRQVVVTRQGAEQFGATVMLRTVADVELRRELSAKSCEDLVKAVGFVISVTYDPPSPEAAGPEAGREPPLAEPAPKPVAPKASSPAALTTPAPVSAERDPEFDYAEPGDIGSRGGTSTWRVGLGGAATWGVAPRSLWGAAAFAAMSWGPRFGAGGLVRISASGDFHGAAAFPGGVAVFRRWSGELAVGPEWHLGGVHLGVAATGRAGLLRAAGRSTLEPQSYDRLWLDAGAAVLGRAELFDGWFLETELGLGKPLTRYAFQFDPIVFHRVSSWLIHVGIAASAAF